MDNIISHHIVDGNHKITFTSPINKETTFTSTHLGRFTSTMELFVFENDEGNNFDNIIGEGCIEWCIERLDEVEYIGVWWANGQLVEYDGVFELPNEAKYLLELFGVKVSEEF